MQTQEKRDRNLGHSLLDTLTSVEELCRSTGDEIFNARADAFGQGSIGQHVRHTLDHFRSFVQGLRNGYAIDYDARPRDESLETSPVLAAECAARLAAELAPLIDASNSDDRVLVSCACSVEREVPAQPSSVGREIQFLVSHTVHHLAMVGAILRLQGVPVSESFGVAPSTIRYRSSSA